jgi:hypothetical protein
LKDDFTLSESNGLIVYNSKLKLKQFLGHNSCPVLLSIERIQKEEYMMHFIKIFPILFVIAMIGLIVSCEDDKTTNPQDQAPTIPPQSSMVINFEEFPDTSSLSKIDFSHATKRNWSWAAGNVAA